MSVKLLIVASLMVTAHGSSVSTKTKFQSKTLESISKTIRRQQQKSANLKGVLVTEKYKLTKRADETQISSLKSFLKSHFDCESASSKVKARFMVSHQTPALANAMLGIAKEEPAYVKQMLKKAIIIRDIDDANKKIDLYETSYSGSGACEYGVDGVIVVDNETEEFLFSYSSWSI